MSMVSAKSGRERAGVAFACSALLVALWLHGGPAAAQTTTRTVTTTNCVIDAYGNCVAAGYQTTTQTTTSSGYRSGAAGWGPSSVRGVARRTSRRTARRVSRRH